MKFDLSYFIVLTLVILGTVIWSIIFLIGTMTVKPLGIAVSILIILLLIVFMALFIQQLHNKNNRYCSENVERGV